MSIEQDAARWKAIIKLAGYIEDGSDEVVKLFWDDATREAYIKVGKRTYTGRYFEDALAAAQQEKEG